MAAQPITTNLASYRAGLVAVPEVMVDEKGKLTLPDPPAHDDRAALCLWLTVVFALDRTHPITGGMREGVRGAAGHVALLRRNAPALRFEPAARINTPARLVEDLSWQALPTDAAVPAFKGEHARQISHVIRMLCGANEALSDADETAGMVATFLGAAVCVEEHTIHGTSPQRYEAMISLQRDIDPSSGYVNGAPRYLIDATTGELVIRVSDLHETARRFIGGSLARGWVDARMQNLGWTRVQLQGYAIPGRDGRNGPHARVDVYRGHLPNNDHDEMVNT